MNINNLSIVIGDQALFICGGHKGVIIQTNHVKDQFWRPINSFTVELTEKWIQGYRKYKEVDEKIVKTVNYSFIKYECK